jgi:glycosyltransferase involved in cell wall biosynthesis
MTLSNVGIVITCYNYSNYVIDAMESILKQMLLPCEIVIVDDKSTDDSVETIKSVLPLFEVYGIKAEIVELQENKGGAGARNEGIKRLSDKVEAVICLDADDKLPVNYIKALKELFDKGNDIIYTDFLTFGDYELLIPLPAFNLLTFRCKNIIHATAMFRRDKFTGYDESLRNKFEDYDLWLNMISKGAKAIKCNDTVLCYRKHGISEINKALDNMLSIKEYFRMKYKDFYLG